MFLPFLGFFVDAVFSSCMLAFNQLVIDANDIRFNRGGSYGKGDVDTVQGWVGEMGILKDTFSEVSGSRP